MNKGTKHHNPNPKCPIRFGEPCTACQPGTSGPNDCQLVQLVREDPDLKELMVEMIQNKRRISCAN